MKEFEPRERVPGAPLDPPLNSLTIEFFAIEILPDF